MAPKNSAPVTDAMVNMRATLDAAMAEGILDRGLAARLAEIGKKSILKKA